MTASLDVGPQQLPPGTSTVTNTLVVNSQVPVGDPLSVVSFLPNDDPNSTNDFNNSTINGVTLNGNYAYVFSNEGVHIVDVSDPAAPNHLRVVRTDVPASGGQVVGDRMVTYFTALTAAFSFSPTCG